MRSLRNFASLLVEVSGFILGFVMLMLFETAWRITDLIDWWRDEPAHLVPVVCSCGRWVFSERDVVWQTWDAGIITGDDLITAIILGRQLIRIRLIAQTDTIRLETVAGPLGISPDGIYLGAHDCALMPVSVKPADMSGREFHYSTLEGFPTVRPDPDNPDPWAGIPEMELMFDSGWPK